MTLGPIARVKEIFEVWDVSTDFLADAAVDLQKIADAVALRHGGVDAHFRVDPEYRRVFFVWSQP